MWWKKHFLIVSGSLVGQCLWTFVSHFLLIPWYFHAVIICKQACNVSTKTIRSFLMNLTSILGISNLLGVLEKKKISGDCQKCHCPSNVVLFWESIIICFLQNKRFFFCISATLRHPALASVTCEKLFFYSARTIQLYVLAPCVWL